MKIGLVSLPGRKDHALSTIDRSRGDRLFFRVGKGRWEQRGCRIGGWTTCHSYITEKKTVYAQIDLTDLPGLNVSEHAAKSEKNPFLTAVRNVDALVAVVRVFQEGPTPTFWEIDPRRDLRSSTRTALSDWELLRNS